jgi:hypothetical protein
MLIQMYEKVLFWGGLPFDTVFENSNLLRVTNLFCPPERYAELIEAKDGRIEQWKVLKVDRKMLVQ